MPAFAAHYLLADDAKSAVEARPLGKLLKENPQAFYWGAQGPDIFLYYHPLFAASPVNRISGALHAGSAPQLLHAMAQYALSQKDTGAFSLCTAYLAGYLCHYCLDSGAHPYVFFHERRLETLYPLAGASARHALIESELDALIYARKREGGLSGFHAKDACAYSPALVSAVFRLYQAVLPEMHKKRLTKARMARCFFDARGFLSLLFSRNPAVLPAARALERIAKKPLAFSAHVRPASADAAWLNEDGIPWRNLSRPEAERTESFPQLYESALNRAQGMLVALDCALSSRRVPDFGADVPFDDGDGR